jgi:hypothetical protein
VQEGHALALGEVGERAHPDEDVVADVLRRAALEVEREDADVRRAECVRGGDRPAEPADLVLDGFVDGDLADRRRDGGHRLSALLEQPVEAGELVVVEVDDVHPPGAPDLDGAGAERLQHGDLDRRVGVDLVAEAGELPRGLVGHGVLSCRTGGAWRGRTVPPVRSLVAFAT